MLIYLFLLILIPTILSYLILTFIYRILFKSKKKVSKFLVFLGSIGLIIFYYTPYSYYLEPSYWQFRNICQLDPEIYQANGGKVDGEYYNKVLGYFDTNIEEVLQGNKGLSRQGNSFNKEINIYHFRGEAKSNRQEVILSLNIEKIKLLMKFYH